MTPLLVLGFLAASAVAAPNSYAGPSHNPGGSYGGGYGPKFSPRELLNLEDFIGSVSAEREDLRNRLDALKGNEVNFLNKARVILEKLDGIDTDQDTQDGRIRIIANRIEQLLIRQGNLEARLAGQVAIASRVEAAINPIYTRFNPLSRSNTEQDGLLAQANTFLQEAKEKLEEKLEAESARTEDEIDALVSNTDAAAALVNSQHCLNDFVSVELGANGNGEGQLDIPANFFSGSDEPTVFCGIQGFVTKINLDQSTAAPAYGGYGHGGYGYVDERQNLAVAINCQSSSDQVQVSAVDQSRGQGNAVVKVYVEVKACSFPAQTGFVH